MMENLPEDTAAESLSSLPAPIASTSSVVYEKVGGVSDLHGLDQAGASTGASRQLTITSST